MEASKTLGRHIPLHFPRPAFISHKPHLPKHSSRKTISPLLASHRPPPSSASSNSLTSFPSLLKPALVSLTAAAAVFFSRHSLTCLAIAVQPPPSSQSETLPSSDESSEQLLEENLASVPDDVVSLRALIEVKVKQQKLPEAIAVVDRLILLEPSDPELHLLRAHLYTYNGETEMAKQGFEEILKVNPFLAEAYHGLVMAASRSRDSNELGGLVVRVEEVMERCEEEEKKVELMDLKLLLAQIRIIEGQFQEALEIYHEMVKEEPRDFRPYLCQGIVYTLMKNVDEADKSFKQYRKLVPKNHPYAQLFASNLSGLHAAIKKGATENVGSLQS